MPVMTSACGTGSPSSPGGRAAPGDDAKQQEDAAAQNVECHDLSQRLRMQHEAEQPDADQRRAAQAEQGNGAHCRGAAGGPAASRPRMIAMDSVSAASTATMTAFSTPAG